VCVCVGLLMAVYTPFEVKKGGKTGTAQIKRGRPPTVSEKKKRVSEGVGKLVTD